MPYSAFACLAGWRLSYLVVIAEAVDCRGDGTAGGPRILGVSQRRKYVMPDTHVLAKHSSQDHLAVYDAIVVGAGISGLYMLYRLRQLGMTAPHIGPRRLSTRIGTCPSTAEAMAAAGVCSRRGALYRRLSRGRGTP